MIPSFLALCCNGCVVHAEIVDKTLLESFTRVLLMQRPTGIGFGKRVSKRALLFNAGSRNLAVRNSDTMKSSMVNGDSAGESVKGTASGYTASVPCPQCKTFDIKDLAGISAPLGFFDPLGFSQRESEGRIRFYREVELKHGRLGMLAALGFLVGEQFHPLFGGNIDVPSYIAFQQTPLQRFWFGVIFIIAYLETYSVSTFNSPFKSFASEPWSIRSDHIPGDLGFDPLNLKPGDPEKFHVMQTKELNNGRLAMLAAAGMISQELASGEKLF